MTLVENLIFDVNGTLLPSSGLIPNYQRGTVANAEFSINGSLRTVATAAGQPRFSSRGYLFLERESTNLLPYSADFGNAAWVKGSSVAIIETPVPGIDGQFNATRLSINATLGNPDAQTMSQELTFESGLALTCTWYLQLASGQFSPNDRIYIDGGVVATGETFLAPVLNESPGNYIPVSVSVTTTGTAPTQTTDDDPEATIKVAIYCESAVSFNVAGVQLEAGGDRTSYITPSGVSSFPSSRDGDSLVYPTSPLEGLESFLFYCNLDEWREDGLVFESGNFKVEIVNGSLSVSAGVVTATDTDPLPTSAKIAARVSKGLERLSIYVNGILKSTENLTGYAGNQSVMTVGADGLRVIRALYLFNRDFGDGSISIGEAIAADLADLHEQDTLLNDLSEGFGQIVFAPQSLPAGDRIQIRLPQIPFAAQGIDRINPGSGDTAQVITVTVEEIANASEPQRDTVTINQSKIDFTSDGNPTTAEIANGLSGATNTAGLEPVTANYSSGDSFTITADIPGNPFTYSVSERLSVELTTGNEVADVSIVVPNAVDFNLGRASILYEQAWIADVSIEAIDLGTNTLTLRIEENSQYGRINVGMTLLQPIWETRIPRESYVAHWLEGHTDIQLIEKLPESFSLENSGERDLTVTPYIKVTL